MTKEITISELKTEQFINEKVNMIRSIVGDGIAINALSGGVDSSTVTMLGHQALGRNLKTCFIENGLMRESEPEMVVDLFRKVSQNPKRNVKLLPRPFTKAFLDGS